MKKIITALIVGMPLIANAYTLTIYNNSSIPMKFKEYEILKCMRLTPRKMILQPQGMGVFNYEYYSTKEECTPEPQTLIKHRLAIRGFPVASEDPEFESFDYVITFELNEKGAYPFCKAVNEKISQCYYYTHYNNDQTMNYKSTVDYDSITIEDK